MEPTELMQQAGELFLARLELVPDGAWNNATPCPEWSVREVAAHVVNGFALVPSLLAHERPDPAQRNRDNLGGSPDQAARAALKSAVEALSQPGALDVMITAPAGEMPARMFALVRMADTVIHTWDMSSGAGIDTTIPADLIQAVLAASPAPFLEGARRAGVFGPAVPVDSDADQQTALLALYGRRSAGDQ